MSKVIELVSIRAGIWTPVVLVWGLLNHYIALILVFLLKNREVLSNLSDSLLKKISAF